MSQNRQQIEYDLVPDIDTVEDAALHVLEMLSVQGHYYTPGILEAFNAIAMTEAQLGLIEKFSSVQLSEKLEKLLGEKKPQGIPEHMERAFWTPMHASAKQILNPSSTGKVDYDTTRLYGAIMLYSTTDAGITNMRLMMRGGPMGAVEVDSQTDISGRRDREVYTGMPAEQTLYVLKRAFLPQLKDAICRQFNVTDARFKKMVQVVKQGWEKEEAISKVDFIKPIDALEWMKHGRLPTALAKQEAAQARQDFGVSPIPPQND